MISNIHGIGLSVAALLSYDSYDYDEREEAISTTTLLKPIKQIAIQVQTKLDKTSKPLVIDVTDLVASRTGSATHDALEKIWLEGDYKIAMKRLGYDDDVIKSIRVNPKVNNPDNINVYVEIRGEKAIGRWLVTGKFDFVGEGKLEDLKNTSDYVVKMTIAEMSDYNIIMAKESLTEVQKIHILRQKCPKIYAYVMQGSIYKMIHPDIILEEYMSIQFIIKDYKKAYSGNPGYPPTNPFQLNLGLFSAEATEEYCKDRLTMLEAALMVDQDSMTPCTDAELWRGKTVWKYFANPEGKRSSKNFTDASAAHQWCAEKGKGIVKEFKSPPRACNYCANRFVCNQAQSYVDAGELEL